MTIKRGEEWGHPIERPAELRSVASDSELAAVIAEGQAEAVTLSGGDLHYSLGAPTPRSELRRLPIDLIEVRLDGVATTAVAHVVMYRSLWRGELTLASNVSMMNGWNIAPRAHPNDGKLDIIEVPAEFGIRPRLQARRRLPSGTHIPHPLLRYRQRRSANWAFDSPMPVRIDGAPPVLASTVEVVALADAASVII